MPDTLLSTLINVNLLNPHKKTMSVLLYPHFRDEKTDISNFPKIIQPISHRAEMEIKAVHFSICALNALNHYSKYSSKALKEILPFLQLLY